MTQQVQHPVQNKIETDYIDSLLGSITEAVVSSENTVQTCLTDKAEAVITPEPEVLAPETLETEIPESLTDEPVVVVAAVTTKPVTSEPVASELVTSEQESIDEMIDDSLYQLVLVGNIKLAIPLSEITESLDGSAVTIQNNIFIHNDESFSIVNLYELIGQQNESTDDTKYSKRYLLIQHRQIAIECEQMIEVEKIEEAFVCWRNESSQRKWLAGTAKEVGVAILDLGNIQQMLLK